MIRVTDNNHWLTITSLCAFSVLIGLCQTANAIPHLYCDDLGFVNWRTNWLVAVQESLATGKPIYVHYARSNCKSTPQFCKQALSDPQVLKMLRRYYVSIAVDYYASCSELDNILKTKGYSEDKTPVHVFLSPQHQPLSWHDQIVPADQFARDLQKNAAEKIFLMSKAQEKEVEKLVKQLEVSLQNKDGKKINQQWQQFLRIPGYSEAKNKGFVLMEAAEEPARKKLFEAAKLIRDQKQPLAKVALEEAQRLAESLPIAEEIKQTMNALLLLDRAIESERQATTAKQKQQTLSLYQQILTKYPDNTVASFVYHKLRTAQQGK